MNIKSLYSKWWKKGGKESYDNSGFQLASEMIWLWSLESMQLSSIQKKHLGEREMILGLKNVVSILTTMPEIVYWQILFIYMYFNIFINIFVIIYVMVSWSILSGLCSPKHWTSQRPSYRMRDDTYMSLVCVRLFTDSINPYNISKVY